jgi:amidase
MVNTWQDIAARKQAERTSRIPKEWLLPASIDTTKADVLDIPRQCGILTSEEVHITEDHDATALLDKLSTGKLTSEAVTRAFCKRAAIAQQLTDCLTEIIFEDAMARAKALDIQFATAGKPAGPLHGLPISLKDTFKIKGYDASVGVAALCFKPCTTNSALVEYLLSLGAVLYCKTNIPLTMVRVLAWLRHMIFCRLAKYLTCRWRWTPTTTSLAAYGTHRTLL